MEWIVGTIVKSVRIREGATPAERYRSIPERRSQLGLARSAEAHLMCGIVGILDPPRRRPSEDTVRLLDSMASGKH